MRGYILMTPHATRCQVNKLRASIGIRQLEPKLEVGVHQHRQLTDQHQAAIGYIAQITNGLVGEPIEHVQVKRQLMPLDKPFDNHDQYHCKRPFSMAALALRITLLAHLILKPRQQLPPCVPPEAWHKNAPPSTTPFWMCQQTEQTQTN